MEYFGEANARPCGRCDVCAAFPVESRSVADRTVMAHALEAVRETTEKVTQFYKWGGGDAVGIAGATKDQIIKLLAGSRAKEMTDLGLDRLASYGKLRPRRTSKSKSERASSSSGGDGGNKKAAANNNNAEAMKNVFLTLEKEGYVESRGDEEDQHVRHPRVVFLTPKGRQWLQERGLLRQQR